jgi:hypothetical protein
MPVAAMPTVELAGISGQKPTHYGGDWDASSLKQKMKVVGDQGPGIASSRRFNQDSTQPGDKIIPVGVIIEYFPAFDATADYVVERSRAINTSLTRHVVFYPSTLRSRNLCIHGRPIEHHGRPIEHH